MRVTPLEIRQKSFEKDFRGYNKDEVSAFLVTLSQEWERILDENKELRIKADSNEREVQKLREVETSLFKTLKAAEDTGANVVDQANKAADLHLRETQFKAEGLMNEAKNKARNIIEESENKSKEILAEMEDKLKALADNYKKLETNRDNVISELKRLATETLERIERNRNNTFDIDSHVNQVKKEARKTISPNIDFNDSVSTVQREVIVERQTVVVESQPKVIKSFFDEIG